MGFRYKKKATRHYEDLVADCARLAIGLKEPLTCAVAVEVVAIVKRPKTVRIRHPAYGTTGRVWCPMYFDVDNLAKSILDGMNRACVYKDDRLVVRLDVIKLFGAVGEDPHCVVTVSEVVPGEWGDRLKR